MAEKFLIDTSAVIKYLKLVFPKKSIRWMDAVLDNESIISFISEIELQAWEAPNSKDFKIYEEFIASSAILGMDAAIINKTIEIRRKQKLKIPDAIIAATAIVNDFTLVADNDKDFKKVKELKYINPATVG